MRYEIVIGGCSLKTGARDIHSENGHVPDAEILLHQGLLIFHLLSDCGEF